MVLFSLLVASWTACGNYSWKDALGWGTIFWYVLCITVSELFLRFNRYRLLLTKRCVKTVRFVHWVHNVLVTKVTLKSRFILCNSSLALILQSIVVRKTPTETWGKLDDKISVLALSLQEAGLTSSALELRTQRLKKNPFFRGPEHGNKHESPIWRPSLEKLA